MNSTKRSNPRRKVDIIVNGKRFPCDVKNICRSSEYFSIMFDGRFSEANQKEIVLNEVSTREFRYFYKFVHPNKSKINNRRKEKYSRGLHLEFLFDLLAFSKRFLVDELSQFCHKRIERYIEDYLENGLLKLPLNILERAFELGDSKLKDIFKSLLRKQFVIPSRWNTWNIEDSREANNGLYSMIIKYEGTMDKEAYKFVVDVIEKHEQLFDRQVEMFYKETENMMTTLKQLDAQLRRTFGTEQRIPLYRKIENIVYHLTIRGKIPDK